MYMYIYIMYMCVICIYIYIMYVCDCVCMSIHKSPIEVAMHHQICGFQQKLGQVSRKDQVRCI